MTKIFPTTGVNHTRRPILCSDIFDTVGYEESNFLILTDSEIDNLFKKLKELPSATRVNYQLDLCSSRKEIRNARDLSIWQNN